MAVRPLPPTARRAMSIHDPDPLKIPVYPFPTTCPLVRAATPTRHAHVRYEAMRLDAAAFTTDPAVSRSFVPFLFFFSDARSAARLIDNLRHHEYKERLYAGADRPEAWGLDGWISLPLDVALDSLFRFPCICFCLVWNLFYVV